MGEFNVIIWNRWGAKVYESNSPSNNWNGTKENGKALEEGLYYYELIYKDRCSGQDEQLKTGYIHLFR